jgi:hypothetical protein
MIYEAIREQALAVRRRPRPTLRPATKDRRLSQGRLQLISLSLGTPQPRSRWTCISTGLRFGSV